MLYALSITQVPIFWHSFIQQILNTYYVLRCPWNLRFITEQNRQSPLPSWGLYDCRYIKRWLIINTTNELDIILESYKCYEQKDHYSQRREVRSNGISAREGCGCTEHGKGQRQENSFLSGSGWGHHPRRPLLLAVLSDLAFLMSITWR